MAFRQLSVLLVCAVLAACGDKVELGNRSGHEVGLLVDAQDGGAVVNDRGFLTSEASIAVGRLTSAPASNELIGFTIERAPTYLATPWTNGDDRMTLTLAGRINVPVTVWIVKGPFAAQRDHAIDACIRTSAIWRGERMGVEFSEFQVIDATADPQAPNHFAFPNGDAGDVVWKPLRDDIGFIPGRLNIYWVDTVNGSTTSGWSNFGAQIAMGRNTGDELLSHEIGHGFSLTHVNANANFDVTNVMHSASNTRQFVTEGQLVRAHLNPSSVLNVLYNARPGQLTRNCALGDADAGCPAIQRRLWADGAFPAN